jgi:hypothetical protein
MRRSAIVAIIVVAAAVAFTVGFASSAYADDPEPCGLVSGCNYVPGGCGQGVNCARVYCSSSSCPSGETSGLCWYCKEGGGGGLPV